jgi:8-amino-7-oxononanoate synthase
VSTWTPCVYPIADCGVERAVARGVPVRHFPHHDTEALCGILKWDRHSVPRPVGLMGGYCPGCGGGSPIAAYAEATQGLRGHLQLDEAQALGILGHSPNGWGRITAPEQSGPEARIGSCLSKGFGVPVAVLAGSTTMMWHHPAESTMWVYRSPPSAAVIYATEQGLAVIHGDSDGLRLRHTQRLCYFRRRLRHGGFSAHGTYFLGRL